MPPPHGESDTQNRPEWFWAFFDARRVGARTVQTLGIYAMEKWFPNPLGTSNCIVFPYRLNGEVVNRKYRPHPAKHPMLQEKAALPTLYNFDAMQPERVVWVEGEMDVAALLECGVTSAVSLKDGAGGHGDRRFEALATHATALGKVRKFILAGDMDKPGLELREELARRLGRHLCWTVDWPIDCKDAGDTLQHYGPDEVTSRIDAATPYPIEGLYRPTPGTLRAMRHRTPPGVLSTGVGALDRILKIPAEGRLIIVTGFPNHGKTSLTRFIMLHTIAKHDRRWAVFSPEHSPSEQFLAECAEVYIGKPFYPQQDLFCMTDDEADQAEEFLTGRVTMIAADSTDEPPTVDWLLALASATVLRDGTTDLLIDPWNELEHIPPAGMTETDYTGRSLQRLRGFGARHGCNIWISPHPAKPPTSRKGEVMSPPLGFDISGSANWVNKPDIGLTVHSPTVGETNVIVWKSRHRRWATRGTDATLEFDASTGRYSTPLAKLPEDGP
jgi:twinkle protein